MAHFTVLLNRNQVSELLKTKFSNFSDTYTTEKGKHILTYGSPKVVVGFRFYHRIQWKVGKATGVRVPIGRLVATPSRIRLGGLITGDGGEKNARFKFEQMDEEEMALVKTLNLERFVPNKA